MSILPILQKSRTPAEDWPKILAYFKKYNTAEKREAAMLALIEARACPRCQSKEVERLQNRRKIYCLDCKKQSSITSGSLLENVSRLDLAHGILTLLDDGVRLNPHLSAKLFDASYDASWTTFKKVSIVIDQLDSNLTPAASLEFTECFSKRSKKTPADKHPRSEQEAFQQESANAGYDSEEFEFNAESSSSEEEDDDDEKFAPALALIEAKNAHQGTSILDLLGPEPMSLDALLLKTGKSLPALSVELLNLEIDNVVEQLPGNNFALRAANRNCNKNANIISIQIMETEVDGISEIVRFFKSNFHGISRKYLPLHLALHWLLHDRQHWMQGSLVKHCLAAPAISRDDIKSVISPLVVHCYLGEQKQAAA